MTFLYFVNCSLITFLPLFVVYRATELHKTPGSVKNVGIGSSLYFLAQLAKLVLIALIFSSFEDGPKFIASHELVKIVLGCIDVSVIWFGYKQSSPTSGLFARLLSLGLGWAVGHHVAYYLPGFWIHARSLQFSYTSTFEALSSVAFLAMMLCLPFLSYFALRKRKDNPVASLLALFGLFFIVSTESIIKFIITAHHVDSIFVLVAQFVCAALVAGITKVSWNANVE